MFAQRLDELLHKWKSTAHGPVTPFFQIASRPPRGVVIPEAVEGFLQVIRAHAFGIKLEHFIESCGLLVAEIFGALKEAVAEVTPHGLIAVSVRFLCFVTSNLVDRFAELFGDVETVEDAQRAGQDLGDEFEVRLPHVRADDLDFRATLRSEIHGEKVL